MLGLQALYQYDSGGMRDHDSRGPAVRLGGVEVVRARARWCHRNQGVCGFIFFGEKEEAMSRIRLSPAPHSKTQYGTAQAHARILGIWPCAPEQPVGSSLP